MAGLTLEGIGKAFGPLRAVAGVDLHIPEGRLVCLLGPSGCGKTTLLRLVAGLETPSAGRVLLDGEDITSRPAHRRNFGMVFQSLALFPHMSVGENIGYGLRIRGVNTVERHRRVEDLLDLVRLPGAADRPVAQLSGGQRQRVAIARALALEPVLFLLDEPLSALDAKLREAMQVELRMLQERLAITTIVVTHDQREAMTMADVVVVMEHGRIQQVGSPLEIYRSPANAFVAGFIGTTNLLPGRVSAPGMVAVNEVDVPVERLATGLAAGAPVTLSVRPEEVHVLGATQPAPGRLPGTVRFVRDLGASVEITVECGELVLTSVTTPKDRPAVGQGDPVHVELSAAACVALAA